MYVYNDYINAYNFAQKFQAVREKKCKNCRGYFLCRTL